ncbi:hypothetical protein NX801_16385 [Streptomyces sp. LP05-1]|uniref:Uncharacterized protein n=1 Tax=Streptomyces pyxinae TaxID=2970734 RepID=A0ABT2CIG8_9ACTN|nr:hypothetical protein [Streptomyces sp. LP05-1]MCS0637211.1 hypothetical protein [Streptomyces sp. LP05-1]
MLLKHLPADSATHRELHGEAADWSVTDHLLAAAVDHLAAANWMFACVNTGDEGDQPEPPQPVPRPGVPDGPDEADLPGETEHPPGTADDASGPSPAALARFFG